MTLSKMTFITIVNEIIMTLSIISEHCYAELFIMAVSYAKCHIEAPYANCHYCECHYAEYHNAECRGTKNTKID